MASNLLTGQRLRFEMQMDPRESIPGRIARGVSEHVLLWTRPVLVAAGVNLRHLGFSQVAAPDELERLAFVARCGVDELLANIGARRFDESSDKSLHLEFGSHSFPSTYFERNRRRISPLSLRVGDFHRLNWMNLLLPYCPESGERLIHECQACHAKLGWHYARGIGTCEFCETEVAPSVQPHLPEHLADGYRLFAKLSSAMGQDVDDAFASLAPALRSSQRDTLIRLATMTGGLAQDGLVVTTSRRAVLDLSSEVRASVIAAGAEFLRTWPHGFKSWVDGRSEELRANREQLIRFRARLQRLVKAKLESEDLVDLVPDSMPELREHPVHAFAKRRHYLYIATQARLRLDNAQMKALRQWMGEGYRPSPTTDQFQKGQFDADVIDALSPVFNSAVPFTACSWRLKIPHYAVEQCCRPGLLTRETHPAFLAVRKASSVQSGSLDALVENLTDKRSTRKKPKGTTSLSVAVKRIGGRPKPWSSILQAIAEGRIKFWIDQDETNLNQSICTLPKSSGLIASWTIQT